MELIRSGIAYLVGNPYSMLMLSVPLFMLANVIGGAYNAKHDFRWSILFDSLKRYLVILIMGGLIFIGATMIQESFEVSTGFDIPLQQIVLGGILAVASLYIKSAVGNFVEATGFHIEMKDEPKIEDYKYLKIEEEQINE